MNSLVSPGKLDLNQKDAMGKLLQSQTFASSPRLREVLSYLVAALDSGTAELVSEQSIGRDVFCKPAGYNASEDNIVRVTIRHLRTRLDDYYKTEGQHALWIMVIPKGKYVPSLVAAHQSALGVALDEAPQATETADRIPRGDFVSASRSWLPWAIPLILLAGAVGGYLFKAASGPARRSSGILGQLCHVGDEVAVVVVDSNLQVYRQVFHHQVTLDAYIHRTYANEPLGSDDPRIADARQFSLGANETNVSSAIIGAEVRQALDGRHVTIKHPHDVSLREFQNQENVILLGGPFINPWGQLFESRLNFRVLPGPTAPAASLIHNSNPKPGEPAEYVGHADGNLSVSYARIAILPNFEGSSHVFLVGATGPESLEAAGSYLLSADSISELDRLFHTHSAAALPALEFVLEVRGLNSVPRSYHIVSYRSVAPASDR